MGTVFRKTQIAFLIIALAAAAGAAVYHYVGRKQVRFCTGNLSVGYFQEYWGTGKPGPGDSATAEFCADMKRMSVSAVCDYLAWCRIEPEPGKWDWSFYDHNERVLHANGLQYSVYCWLQFPPKWFMETSDYVPYRCLEHDEAVQQTSLWAPGTLRAYDRFYKELAAHFGDRIDFIRLAMPSEYGEVGYPCGMTKRLVSQEHVHPGYWCNDAYARSDFRATMTEQYESSIALLNESWGTNFNSFDEISFPEAARHWSRPMNPLTMSPGERREMLDFIGWYYDSQIRFAREAIGIVRKYYPRKEIILSMGYGSQRPIFGNDDYGVAKLCGDLKVSCQTPGHVPYFVMKDLSSPCHFYGAPYYTEPPGNLNPNEEVKRIWSDASCGAQTYFDYPQNLLGARKVFESYGHFLDGEQSLADIAILFPTTDHRLRNEDWPERTALGAENLREVADYDFTDERMIQDGALRRYQLLLAYDGSVMEASTLAALRKWLSDGGILLVRDFGPVETVEGDRSFYERLFPKPAGNLQQEMGTVPSGARGLSPFLATQSGGSSGETELTQKGFSITDLISHSSRRIGKGSVIVVPSDAYDDAGFADLAADLAHNLSSYFPGTRDVPAIGDALDDLEATLFPDRILYLNSDDKPVTTTVKLRQSDFPALGRTGRPEKWEYKLSLGPHSIQAIGLR